jgi:hypothetical protein
MRIESLTAERIESYHACIDAVARERRAKKLDGGYDDILRSIAAR